MNIARWPRCGQVEAELAVGRAETKAKNAAALGRRSREILAVLLDFLLAG
jgi:hypothetical protein